jgi:hypothetical protein
VASTIISWEASITPEIAAVTPTSPNTEIVTQPSHRNLG